MAEELSRQKLELICGSALFTRVDEILVEQIVLDRRCQCRQFRKGEVISDPDHVPRCLGVVLAGKVRVEQSVRGKCRMKMSELQPGECFGAEAVFQESRRYPRILTAACSTEVLLLSEDMLRWAMQRNFTVTENYIRYLSGQIQFLHEKITNLTAGTAEERLALFLTEHCASDGSLQTSMTDLCSQLNLGRATLYRALEALEARGLIARGNKAIYAPNLEKIRNMAWDKETEKQED